MSAHVDTHTHDDHGHHHKETFVTKYIFSQDHKMIAKQYLITGTILGIIGVMMSILSCIGNYTWNHHGILCIDCRIKWYF